MTGDVQYSSEVGFRGRAISFNLLTYKYWNGYEATRYVNIISPGDVTNTGVYNETLHKL